jgi:hypothetical protein
VVIEAKRRVEEARRQIDAKYRQVSADAVAQARKSKARLRLIIDTIPVPAWSSRADGATEFVNQRWFNYTGITEEQALGWGWKVVSHPGARLPLRTGDLLFGTRDQLAPFRYLLSESLNLKLLPLHLPLCSSRLGGASAHADSGLHTCRLRAERCHIRRLDRPTFRLEMTYFRAKIQKIDNGT